MKTFILFLLLTVFVCGQYQADTMNVSIVIPADSLVIDQIETLECFFQESVFAGNIGLRDSMSIAEARALGGVLDTTFQGSPDHFTYNVIANGNYFNFAIFGLAIYCYYFAVRLPKNTIMRLYHSYQVKFDKYLFP